MLRGPCAVWREASRHAFVTAPKLSLLLPRRMVLTRRAASCRAEKSIIRWLPNEILKAVMLEVAVPDLLSLLGL
jgi:hypothetical protein